MSSNSFYQAHQDLQALHSTPNVADFANNHPARFASLLRKQTKAVSSSRGRDLRLAAGQLRMSLCSYVGAGSDGVVFRALATDYYEFYGPHHVSLQELSASPQVVIKIREVPVRAVDYQRMTLVREIFMGMLVRQLGIPFVAGIRRWWMWNGVETDNVTAFVTPQFGGVSAQISGDKYDVTDFMPPQIQDRVRAVAVGMKGEQYDSAQVTFAYVTKRAQKVGTSFSGHHVVLELQDAGAESLHDVLINARILSRRTIGGWNFFRTVMLTIGQQLLHLQQTYNFVHGDASINNIVMGERTQLPHQMANFGAIDAFGNPTHLTLQHFTTPGNPTRFMVPTFIDPSRSSVGDTVLQHSPHILSQSRRNTFDRDAWQHLDGYSRTLDIRRLGLTLAHLIMRALTCSSSSPRHISLGDMDWRIVLAVRTMIDGSGSWATLPDFNTSHRPYRLAKETTLHGFLVNWLYVVDTMNIARNGASTSNATERASALNELKRRSRTFFEIWEICSTDMNNYHGWMLAAHPTIEQGDIRTPEHFINWDVWRQ